MTQPSSRPEGFDPSPYLPWLLLLFAGSGCAALVYEIVWFQMLQLAIGSTTVSLGVLLATFMGGLCLGSILYPRFDSGRHHPLLVYAVIEAGIGIFGLLVLVLLPLVDRIYVTGAEHGMPAVLLRSFMASVCLLPPTILMGASLPAIARWIESTPRGASWWGLLYGWNTAGAVTGCLVAGFFLLRLYNMPTATYAAAALNFAVALLSYVVAMRTPAHTRLDEPAPAVDGGPVVSPGAGSHWPVLVTIGLSGACALGAQVIWTRLMGMLLGLTVYAFAIILAVFLVGLALGSGAGALLSRVVRPRLALGWTQILIAFAFAWTAYIITHSLPYWPINPLLSTNPWTTFQLDLVRCIWAIFPPTLLWGASFPLALAAAAKPGEDPGRVVGGVYAANTLGAILGALITSLILVPAIGTQSSQRLLLVLSALSALFVLLPHLRQSRSMLTSALLPTSLLLVAVLSSTVDRVSGGFIMWGRQLMSLGDESRIVYTAEGRNSSLAIAQWDDGTTSIGVNGHVEATTLQFDMKLQRMVGHLPALLHPDPKKILGIGFGAGVSAGTFTRYPGVESIVVCEIEPLIPPVSTRFFAKANYEVMLDKRTRIVYDDARHYLMTTTEKFDIIASDPLDVFAKGTAALYTTEYFEAVKRHLNPGGFFTLYVPLYESDLMTVKSELATFFEAFPHGTVWNNTINGRGYDMVFMGQVEPLKVDLDKVFERFNSPAYSKVAESMREIGYYTPNELFATYTGGLAELGAWVKGAPINRDRNLKLQYLAGWGINSRMEDIIYGEMMSYRGRQVDVFTGSPGRVQTLLRMMGLASWDFADNGEFE